MTDEEKNKSVFGELVEVSVIKTNESGEEYLESETVKIKPIRQKNFVEAMTMKNKNDIVGFVSLCVSSKDIKWIGNDVEPKSFMNLYLKCVEINKTGFFAYIETIESNEEAGLKRFNRIAENIPQDRLEKLQESGLKLMQTKS